MEKLRTYIQKNRELFESDPLPEGHKGRFLERLSESQPARRYFRFNYLIYISVAALLLLVLTIGVRFLKEDPATSLFADPCSGESYSCYYDRILKLSNRIEYDTRSLPQYRRQEILMNMKSLMPGSSEDFTEMLPEEISEKEAERLKREYYQRLYEGMKEIASLTN
ncbi:MAG: hypothetical protein GT600_02595 [Bacteroidales bacterium]|nr:hypothetical protein [Bacteroidales bacterium]HPW78664.1 hypothetical protein [Bacteroidales bacterium]HQB56188.1 hypothetical protein [Bacteroidales bacterium]